MSGKERLEKKSLSWRLVIGDTVLSFMWVVSLVFMKVLARDYNFVANEEFLRMTLSVVNVFIFTWIGRAIGGATFSPVSLLTNSFTTHKSQLLTSSLITRIASQCFGSVIGISFLKHGMKMDGLKGPVLQVGWTKGMVMEGVLTYVFVMVRLVINLKGPNSFFMATWIGSVTRLSLNIIGAEYTGSPMNPASAFGWAYLRGEHGTKEHIFVYWLAPLQACILAGYTFKTLVAISNNTIYAKHMKASKVTEFYAFIILYNSGTSNTTQDGISF